MRNEIYSVKDKQTHSALKGWASSRYRASPWTSISVLGINQSVFFRPKSNSSGRLSGPLNRMTSELTDEKEAGAVSGARDKKTKRGCLDGRVTKKKSQEFVY